MAVRDKILMEACLILISMVQCISQQSFSTMEKRPRLFMKEGNMYFLSGAGKNISFVPGSSQGTVLLNGLDVRLLPSLPGKVEELRQSMERLQTAADLEKQKLVLLSTEQRTTIQGLRDQLDQLSTLVRPVVQAQDPEDKNLQKRLRKMQRDIFVTHQLVNTDECASNPCQNGGSCIDGIGKFYCFCLPQYTGQTCTDDVNECLLYAGTDLACQNGATCRNSLGGFECDCAPGWHGYRCQLSTDECKQDIGQQLCGPHGTCISVAKSPGSSKPGYKCICEAGWASTDTINPHCNDVDECASQRSNCYAGVACINTPGSFICGLCPVGLTGNGMQCSDIDECSVNNGGCSTNPTVQCFNTFGFYHCGACPTGYDGNGRTCSPVSPCSTNPCHPLAQCFEAAAAISGYRCQCPEGYVGSGIGFSGCQLSNNTPCMSFPCLNQGTCQALSPDSYRCHCTNEFYGQRCERANPCNSSPCQYSGTCVMQDTAPDGFSCVCIAGHYGRLCELEDEGCGGHYQSESGSFSFPVKGYQYLGNRTCDWTIQTLPGKILNVTFPVFSIEPTPLRRRGASQLCPYDNLTIFDGSSGQAPMIGTYCGFQGQSEAPDDFLLSSDQAIFLRFRSDASIQKAGFSVNWTSSEPTCSKRFFSTSGFIRSPGFPRNYAANQHCLYQLVTIPGFYFEIQFSNVMFDSENVNCTGDYIEVFDGQKISDRVVRKICSSMDSQSLTVTSSLPYATIYFHSDNKTALTSSSSSLMYPPQSFGFTITFNAKQISLEHCGGTTTATTGEISSPNFGKGNYFNNIDCVWLIDVSAIGHSAAIVEFVIMNLDIMGHATYRKDQCFRDFLELRNGGDERAPLIGHYCGQEIGALVRTSGPKLWIHFHADSDISGAGFKATYGTKCGGHFKAPNGTFQSPNFPNAYGRKIECIYTIVAPATHEISLEITSASFGNNNSLVCAGNKLQIDGGPPFLSSKSLCVLNVPFTVVGQRQITVKFFTDGSSNNLGFQANFKTQDIGCGGLYYRNFDTIRSPKNPAGYGHNLLCRYDIEVPLGLAIRLNFKTFHLEADATCRFDFLAVYESYENENKSEGFKGRFCGSMMPPSLTSTSNRMVILFRSDHSVSFDGFVITYNSFNATSDCSRSFYGPSTEIISPGFPQPVDQNVDCEYHLNVDNGFVIRINFQTFNVPCSIAYFEIRNGPDSLSPGIPGLRSARMCDDNAIAFVKSQSNRLYLRFKVSHRHTVAPTAPLLGNTSTGVGPRFQILFEELAEECGANLIHASGSFASPQYPLQSSNSYDCIWHIIASEGNRIVLTIHSIDLAENQDCTSANRFRRTSFLRIIDGSDLGSNLLKRFCASEEGIPSIVSSGNQLSIHYYQNLYNSGSHKGFIAHYSTECKKVRLSGQRGVLESPNYCQPYFTQRDCEWFISTTIGNRLILELTYLKIEGNNDRSCENNYFQFIPVVLDQFDNEQHLGSENITMTTTICDTSYSPGYENKINISTHAAYIRFKSSEDFPRNHFRLEWYTDGCGGYFKEPSGILLGSRNTTVPGAAAIECQYTIEAPPGHYIELVVERFNVIGLRTICQYNAMFTRESSGIHIFYAPNNASGYAQVSRCNAIEPPNQTETFRSPSNHLYVLLRTSLTDLAKDDEGVYFFATYTIKEGANYSLVLKGEKGTFHSPGYPQSYEPGSASSYLLQVPEGNIVSVQLIYINMGNYMSMCRSSYALSQNEGYIAFYDGENSTAPRIRTVCSNSMSTTDPSIRSSSNKMYVEFYGATDSVRKSEMSDGQRSSQFGFVANFTALCGARLKATASTKMLTIPQSSFDATTGCEWLIEAASPGDHVQLVFNMLRAPPFQPVAYPLGNRNCQASLSIFDGREPTNETERLFTYEVCARTNAVLSPVVSSGDSLFIRLKRVLMGLSLFFHLSYFSSVSVCGADFYSNEGSFTSPQYPKVYPTSIRCEWTIHVAEGNEVKLDFITFDIDRSENCAEDYIEVREGHSAGKVLGRFCGNSIPTDLQTIGDMWVSFRSDESDVAVGFSAKYRLNFGASELTGTSGVIASPNIDSPFEMTQTRSSFGNPKWRISVAEGLVVRLTFLDFHIPVPINDEAPVGSNYRWYHGGLAIYNGFCDWGHSYVFISDSACSLLKTLTGLRLPAPIISSSNQISLQLNIALFHSQRGFRLVWEAIEPPMTYSVANKTLTLLTPEAEADGCGGTLMALEGVQSLSSPGFPSGYPSNKDCRWTIEPPLGHGVWLNFSYMDIEEHADCKYDYVLIEPDASVRYHRDPLLDTLRWRSLSWNNYWANVRNHYYTSPMSYQRNSVKRYCGKMRPAPILLRKTAYVLFHSDMSINRTGFTLQYKTTCGGDIVDAQSGTISSPGYPQSYPINTTCVWRLRVRTGRTIKLTFNYSLEASDECTKDYLLFKNGFYEWSPQLGERDKYCGGESGMTLESTSNELSIEFHSDVDDSGGRGFQLKFQETAAACDGQFELTELQSTTIISSPNWPNEYPHNSDCTWTVTAPRGKRIRIDFNRDTFELEDHPHCQFDYVQLLDGASLAALQIGRFCGRTAPATQWSTGNYLTIRFRTDATSSLRGFSIETSLALCGGTLVGRSGVIKSPGYPGRYQNNVNCEWTLVVPEGHFINFTFVDINLVNTRYFGPVNCSEDYVEIRENNSTGDLIGRYCFLQQTIMKTSSTSNILHVRFKTNGDKTAKGFKLSFQASSQTCGGILTESSAVITSPNYPSPYPNSRRCDWKIQVPFDRRVTLQIDDLDIPNINGNENYCWPDGLKVFSGPVEQEHANLANYCGRSDACQSNSNADVCTKPVAESTGNEMSLLFQSDTSVNGRGFKASYNSDLPAICGGYLTSNTVIMPPTNESHSVYLQKSYCHWLIQNPRLENSSIVLQFSQFSLENGTACQYDYVKIYAEDSNGLAGPEQKFCGRKANFRLLFYQPTIHVIFRSDHSVADLGFNLSVSFSDCGGIIANTNGYLSSPNYPESFFGGLHCIWLLNAPEGQNVQLRMDDIHKELDCTESKFVMRNGKEDDSPELRSFCSASSSDTGELYTTGGRFATVLLSLNDSNPRFRFKLHYEMVATGCNRVITGTSGQLTSPSFPRDYANNEYCKYEVVVAVGYSVQLSFSKFDVEESANCTRDFLLVSEKTYNVNELNAPWTEIVGGLCGINTPSPVRSQSNRMMLEFVSNNAVTAHGFNATWEAVCGASYTSDWGYVQSPSYPNDYEPYLNCSYIIRPPDTGPYQLFTLIEFQEMDIEKTGPNCPDYLMITELLTGRVVGKFCGTELPDPQSTLGPMLLTFFSDSHISGKGFVLRYSANQCGGTYNLTETGQLSVTIESPGFPARYHNNLDCRYIIIVPEQFVVDLKFTNFSLEYHVNCNYDFVDVRDGNDPENSTLIGRFCGSQAPAATLKTVGNVLSIRFVADRSMSLSGFSAVATLAFGEKHGCGGQISVTATGGQIVSPRNPETGNYFENLNCVWQLTTSDEQEIIHLDFELFELEEVDERVICHDYVEVYDGVAGVTDPVWQRCGVKAPNALKFRSSTNTIGISFHTDNVLSIQGFIIKYSLEEAICGGKQLATTTKAYLFAPDTRHLSMTTEIRCRWLIQANETINEKLQFKVNSKPNSSCDEFRLQFSEKSPRVRSPKAKTVCGGVQQTSTVNSEGSILQIDAVFGRLPENDARASFIDRISSFNISFQLLQECNRSLVLGPTDSGGRLTSANFPNPYPHHSKCLESIQAPEGNRITLYFASLHMEAQSDCRYDFIQVADTPPKNDTGRYCGVHLPPTYTSSNNVAYLRFTSDHSVAFGGYDLTYTFSENGCGGNVTADSGTITSPNYPEPYGRNIACVWHVHVEDQTKGIRLHIANMDLPGTMVDGCSSDSIVIRDEDVQNSQKYNMYCGTDEQNSVEFESGRVTVAFYTDKQTKPEQRTAGFRINFETTPKTLSSFT